MKQIQNLLQEMTLEQKEIFVKILGLKKSDDQEILTKISKILLPAKGWLQDGMTYEQFLTSIAENNNEKINFSDGVVNAERQLYLKLYQNEFEKLSDAEKLKITNDLEKAGLNKNQISSLSGLAAIGTAQLSGIGIYLLASSTVGAISSLLGITLPFALYTGMSSAISFVIGPVGFLVMGVMLYRSFKNVKSWSEAQEILNASWKELGTLVKGDYARATQIFKYIAASRIVLEENFKTEIENNHKKIEQFNLAKSQVGFKIENLKSEIQSSENQIVNEEKNIYHIQNEIREREFRITQIRNEILIKRQSIDDSKLKLQVVEIELTGANIDIKLSSMSNMVIQNKIKNITQ
jgi:hypothetical protein